MSITLNTVSSGYNLSAINANFQSLQTALNNNILWRTGSVAGEAMMDRDLDLNGHTLLNFAVNVDEEGSLLTVGVADSRYVNVTGDAMTGPLAMGNNKITGLANGTVDTDAATHGQLEDESDYRASADASLQAQISGLTPVLIEERPVVQYHSNTLANSFNIPAEMNAFSIGPQITIEPGQTVTLGENSYWNILGNVFEADQLYNVTANNLTTSNGASTVSVANLASVAGTGVVPVSSGGTGASTAATARTNLGIGSVATQDASAVAITGGSVTGITDLAVADGGTGASTAANARTNLGAAASGANTDITSITGSAATLTTARTVQTNLASTSSASFNGSANITPGVTGTLPLTNGGTGATTAAAARTNLGAAASAGVTDASVAAAGVVGELLTSTGTSTSMTSGTTTAVGSLALTAGDWEVIGVYESVFSSTTSATAIVGAVGTTSGTMANFPARWQHASTLSSPGTIYFTTPSVEFNVSAATTVYANLALTFTGGTATGRAYIKARRIR